jgi:hypothetical protein
VGRYADAREPAAFAAEHGDEIEGSLALGVLAKLAARSGVAPTALETIAEAVARVDRTDFLFDRGTVYKDRGETLRLLAGKTRRSRPSTRRSGCSIRRATSSPRSGSAASATRLCDR